MRRDRHFKIEMETHDKITHKSSLSNGKFHFKNVVYFIPWRMFRFDLFPIFKISSLLKAKKKKNFLSEKSSLFVIKLPPPLPLKP